MEILTLTVGTVQTNCYVIVTQNKKAVVVDPGDEVQKIRALLKKRESTLEAILLTHGHFDHLAAVGDLLDEYPEVLLFIGKNELEVVQWSESFLVKLGQPLVAQRIINDAILVGESTKIEIDELTFTVLETPGHTIGGVIYQVGNTWFSGDTLFRDEIGRCDLPTGNYETMRRTLGKLYRVEGEYKVYPGHESSTTLSHEKNYNPYMKERL